MLRRRVLFRGFVLAGVAAASVAVAEPPIQAEASPPPAAIELARAVEQRAMRTNFAALEAFGRQALKRNDREGRNRLYHVAWTFLNQGDFERAALWNSRLEAQARAADDRRYLEIARLNRLTARYDQGDLAVAADMGAWRRRPATGSSRRTPPGSSRCRSWIRIRWARGCASSPGSKLKSRFMIPSPTPPAPGCGK